MERDTIWQETPASGLGQRWRDAIPLGNGLTGVLQYGGVAADSWILNRYDLWHNGQQGEIPDVSGKLAEMRQLAADGRYEDACGVLCDAMAQAGYDTTAATMRSVAEIRLRFDCPGLYAGYRRALQMDTGEAELTYTLDGKPYRRRTFVSRRRDVVVCRMESPQPAALSLEPGFYVSHEGEKEQQTRRQDEATLVREQREDVCCYSVQGQDGTWFGVCCRAVTDGSAAVSPEGIAVTGATDTLLLARVFSGEPSREQALKRAVAALGALPADYDRLLREHIRLHRRLYAVAQLRLYAGRACHSNEWLLQDARRNRCSPELAEKLWRFGRYLFISGVHETGLPFPLYGLWAAGYDQPWTQHVGNENVEILHWHAAVGGLSALVRPLIRYYCGMMDTFRQAAQRVFGCRGIFVSTYTSPGIGAPTPCVPVILHFCGTAGWLSRHFYEYYRMTGDEETLRREILPFMLETAAFYEDYATYDGEGQLVLYPSVSPENSPREFQDTPHPTVTGHPMPVTKNATIELAILKELLSHLLELHETHPLPADRVERWKAMLAAIPDYRINEDGAIAEWVDPAVHDYYAHRHLSQVYPAFPGEEIGAGRREELLPAFRKAAQLRQMGFFTGWSMAHTANIYARLGSGEAAMTCLDGMAKVCLLPNFFTLHNDYRGMGITTDRMGNETFAPVQLDALMGSVSALQEMLLTVMPERICLLPALPERLAQGSFTGARFYGGRIDLRWDAAAQTCRAVLTAQHPVTVTVELPFGGGCRTLTLAAGETAVLETGKE